MPSASRPATDKNRHLGLNPESGAETLNRVKSNATDGNDDGGIKGKKKGSSARYEFIEGWEAAIVDSLGSALGDLDTKKSASKSAARPESKAEAEAAAIKKYRGAMMAAAKKKDLPALAALIAQKSDVNFMAKKGARWQSPLGVAVADNWPDGVMALVKAGAQESLARARRKAEEPEAMAAVEASPPKERQWAWIHSDEIFEALIDSEQDPEELKSIAKSMVGDVDKALILLRAGKERLASTEQWDGIEHEATERVRSWTHMGFGIDLNDSSVQMLMALWEKCPERLAKPFDERWEAAVRLDQPRMLAILAKGRAAPPKDWKVTLSLADLDRGWADRARSERASALTTPSMGELIAKSFDGIKVDLWSFAVAVGSRHCVEALGRVAPLLARALGNLNDAHKMALLVGADGGGKKAGALREARKLGLNLDCLVDGHGETPLHALCRNNMAARSVVMEMARLCPSWISKKNVNGKTPFDILADKNAFPGELGKMIAELEAKSFKKDFHDAKAKMGREGASAGGGGAASMEKNEAESARDGEMKQASASAASPQKSIASRRL